MASDFLSEPLGWPFPAEGVHHGVPLGNGVFGALVWGGSAEAGLRLTINRADYWDHHGGLAWGKEASFARLKDCLARRDEAELRRVFEGRADQKASMLRPTRLPMGRVDLAFQGGAVARRAALDLFTSEATLDLDAGGAASRMRLVVPRGAPALAAVIEGSAAESARALPRPVDAPDVVRRLRDLSYPDPAAFGGHDEGGWVQERPGEDALAVAWRFAARSAARVEFFACAIYGATAGQARAEAARLLHDLARRGYEAVAAETATWWRAYWRAACAVRLPDRDLELLYYLGMYKLAGLSMPGTPAATLQGPWVEEHHFPPWSSDYHFNINVQECYWPAFAGNHPEALLPLADMLKSWKPRLRDIARKFTGRRDGLMLPHAVDDRCTCMGGFWTGSVDHGSTAWVGQLLWLYYRYTMDRAFLAEHAYPFLRGAMSVYEAMLERDGDALALPVGVSPEFGGAGSSAWGRNASFQLAAIHWLCRTLVEASRILDVDRAARQRWAETGRRLPLAAFDGEGERARIALWQGQGLTESHRHHSHLAGIYPFDIFDPEGNPEHRRWVQNSMEQWTLMGMGAWTGWAMPWASILCARTGRPDMASAMLRLYRQAFMNEGHASLHDARFPGLTIYWRRKDLMQIEAALAASAAVLEMLAFVSRGKARLFVGAPAAWTDASFEGLRVEGAFLVGAERRDGRVARLTVRAEAGGRLALVNPWPGEARLVRGRRAARVAGPVLAVSLRPGEEATLLPA